MGGLSDHEHQVLADLEARLEQDAGELAHALSTWRWYGRLRRVPWLEAGVGSAAFVAGLAVLLVSFTWSVWVAFASYLVMAAGSWALADLVGRHLREGRAHFLRKRRSKL